MPAMDQFDIAPHEKTDLDLHIRKDVLLIADVETRSDGKFNMTVHSIPKTEQNEEMIYAMKTDRHAFRSGDHNDTVTGYMGVLDGALTLRASRENWHYATWKNEKTYDMEKGWLLLDSNFENQEMLMGANGLPMRIDRMIKGKGTEVKDSLHIVDPRETNIISSTTLHYEGLQHPYAVNSFSVHVYPNGRLNDISFHKKNHPTLNISAVVYAGEHPGNRIERMPENAGKNTLSDKLSYEEALPIWEKVGQYDHNTAHVCNVFGIPDVSQFSSKPPIMMNINTFGFDGVCGNYCPALDKTYQRLGMHYQQQ